MAYTLYFTIPIYLIDENLYLVSGNNVVEGDQRREACAKRSKMHI